MELRIIRSRIFISFILCLANFQLALSSLFDAWDNFLTFSCNYKSKVEYLFQIQSEKVRLKRASIYDKEPLNFEDPTELFNYLYPLAHVTSEESGQRALLEQNTFSAWFSDLTQIWISACDDRFFEEVGKESEEEIELESIESPRVSSFETHNMSFSDERREIRSLRSEDENTNVTNRFNKRRILRKKGVNKRRRLEMRGDETTTGAPETTTTAPTSDDNFFSSYGGDIEYFFPLISFGIPFDGEITFLGFHGFKGLFPY